MINDIHAIQIWSVKDAVWRTIYLTTYGLDCQDSYEDLASAAPSLIMRCVVMTLPSLDKIATEARDFKVVSSQGV